MCLSRCHVFCTWIAVVVHVFWVTSPIWIGGDCISLVHPTKQKMARPVQHISIEPNKKNGSSHPLNQTYNMDIFIPISMDIYVQSTLSSNQTHPSITTQLVCVEVLYNFVIALNNGPYCFFRVMRLVRWVARTDFSLLLYICRFCKGLLRMALRELKWYAKI